MCLMTWRAVSIGPERQDVFEALDGGQFEWVDGRQGLILVHFSAQPEPFWSQLPVSPCLIDWGEILHPKYPTNCAYVELRSGRVSAPDGRHWAKQVDAMAARAAGPGRGVC